jgi:hypothetical protein
MHTSIAIPSPAFESFEVDIGEMGAPVKLVVK